MVALPILPSLLPKAHAQVPSPSNLIIIGSEHGGTGYRDWYPQALRDPLNPPPSLTEQQLFTGSATDGMDHKIRHARLNTLLTAEPGHPGGDVDSGQARLSYILNSQFNPYIEKMNLYQGIDIGPEYQGHGVGVISGNISGVSNSATYRDLQATPSLDQFLAAHPNFYGGASDHSVGSIIIAGRSLSWDSSFQRLPSNGSSANGLFNNVFSKYDQDPQAIAKRQQKKFLVDKVLEDYNNLMSGAYGLGRKISSEDRQKVEGQIESLFNIQKKVTGASNNCSLVGAPATNDWDTRLDLIVAAMNCGATRLATLWSPVMSNIPNYHQDVAHQAGSDAGRRLDHSNNFRSQTNTIVAKLIEKMDAVDVGGGKTLLDQSLVYWQHESGVATHSGYSVNLVSFGSANGFLNTGHFVDYRNLSNYGLANNKKFETKPGLLVNQWWTTICQAMGMRPQDYETGGEPGYGTFHRSTRYPYGSAGWHGHRDHLPYPERIYQATGNTLPIIT